MNVAGNCGLSLAPVNDQGADFLKRSWDETGFDWDWRSVGEYLARLERQGSSIVRQRPGDSPARQAPGDAGGDGAEA